MSTPDAHADRDITLTSGSGERDKSFTIEGDRTNAVSLTTTASREISLTARDT